MGDKGSKDKGKREQQKQLLQDLWKKRERNDGSTYYLHDHPHGKSDAIGIFHPKGKEAQGLKEEELEQRSQYHRKKEEKKMPKTCREYQVLPEKEKNHRVT